MHPCLFCFEFPSHLPYDELRVALEHNIFTSECLSYSQSRQHGLIFCLVIGYREFKLDPVLKNIFFRGSDNDACSASFLNRRPISVYRPETFYVLGGGEFCYEIGQRLSFYGCPWTVFYVKLAELNSPLYHSSCRFGSVHYLFDGLVRHYNDGVGLKVWTKFSRSHNQGEGDLFYARIPRLGTLESLADIVYRKLQPVFFFDQCCTDGRNRYS